MNSLKSLSAYSAEEGGSADLLYLLVTRATEYGLILFDQNCLITYFNEGAEKIFGYKSQEILEKHINSIFITEDIELGVAEKEVQWAIDHGHSDDDRWHKRKDGSRFWASGVVTCFRDQANEIVGFSKVIRDQTCRKLTEDGIQANNQELTQFCYGASHDLVEPLRTISSYLQMAKKQSDGKLNETTQDCIDRALEAAKQGLTLVDALQAFTKVKNFETDFQRTDMEAVFDAASANLSHLVNENKAVVTRTTMPDLMVSPTQMVQLFQNLISNSVRYRSESAPKIYAEANEKEDHWEFSVCDNGIGIAKEYHEKIFEPFTRLHAKHERPGSGLGLTICKKIIEGHGGKIWIEEKSEGGARFCFTLPKTPLAKP